MLTIIIITIYLVSLFSSCYLNKWLFKIDSDYPIIPILWIIPFINTFTIFALIFLILANENSNFGIFSSEYWKNKWN
jgi:hypothetical protein